MTHLSEQDDAQSEVNTSVSRRTIMAGAAWTVPVIVTATASPAIAATAAPNLVWDSGTISRNPSWNGQDSDGRGYVDANDTMFADYKVSNNGTASADGYSIS
ncbi:MAG: hypothetical protein FJW64_13600, partial [Actinobacteria bacterium]|nr:hypothetical protein [Actinomycetota bacterium]